MGDPLEGGHQKISYALTGSQALHRCCATIGVPRIVFPVYLSATEESGHGMVEIHHDQEDSGGRYWAEVPGGQVEMTYSRASDQLWIIDHTEVPDKLRGKGFGQMLVAQAVLDARISVRKLMPLCPFANAQFQRHPEWHDVLN